MTKINTVWILLLSVFLTIVTGCTVGPDYQAPATAVPNNWHGAAAAGEPNLVQWWVRFNDPVLSSLIDRAIQNNLDLKLAQSRIRQARATRIGVDAGLWPSVDVSGSATRSRSFTAGGGSTGNLFRTGLDAAWELDLFGGTRRDVEAAEADIQAAVEDLRYVWVSMAAEIAFNYIELRGYQQEIEIAKQNLTIQQHSVSLTKQRTAAGFDSALDVANAEALVATTLAQIPTLETYAQQSIYTLGILLGGQPSELVDELTAVSAIPRGLSSMPTGVPSDLLLRRADIRMAEAQIHAATARIGAATADLFPRLTLTGSVGFQSAHADTLANWNKRLWSIGPSASWNIFDAGRIKSNIEARKALQEQYLLTYQKTVLLALQDVENVLVASAKEQQRRDALQKAVDANLKAVDLSKQLYAEGVRDFLNVIDAQRALYSSQDALVRSDLAISANMVALYKALGGGWEL